LRTSAWLFPQKEHIVKLDGRAMLETYSVAVFSGSTAANSFRDCTTSSTRP